MNGKVRRRWRAVLTILTACAALQLAPQPASAGPPGRPLAADSDTSTSALQAKLREAARGYTDAAAKLDSSRKRQAALQLEASMADVRVAELTDEINRYAGIAYRTAGIDVLVALLDSGSPDQFLARSLALDSRLRVDDGRLRDLRTAKADLARTQAAVAGEVRTQQAQVAEMAKRKKAAEAALAAVGGGASSGLYATGASAQPAPRNPDGTWPPESCSVDDPTSGGCLTPRTYHAYQQARAAGFTRYTACWRSGSSGEHPKGRACDFSASTSGFVNASATGADKAYGDRLASWLVGNASRLGVLYVIWYRQIWMPSTGWRAYSGDGTPAGNHTNHVHMSIY